MASHFIRSSPDLCVCLLCVCGGGGAGSVVEVGGRDSGRDVEMIEHSVMVEPVSTSQHFMLMLSDRSHIYYIFTYIASCLCILNDGW